MEVRIAERIKPARQSGHRSYRHDVLFSICRVYGIGGKAMGTVRGRCLLLATSATAVVVLAFSVGARAQEVHAGQNSQSSSSQAEHLAAPHPLTAERSPEMEKLATMLVGNWEVVATREPSAARPKGLRNTGTNRIVLGPGGRSIVENFHTEGDTGPRSALGILWWDAKAQGYRTMFCDTVDPAGCSVYDGLGKWEGNDLIFEFKLDHDGIKINGKEMFMVTSPFSYTVRFFESRNGGPEDATWTVNNTKAE